jgi:hypothetical protein
METLEWKDLLLGPPPRTAPLPQATASVGVLLVLHAFAAGYTARAGVEALSNGVPAFRPPEARNARRTLVAMGMILGSLFIGVSFLAVRVGVRPYASGNPTLIGQLARWVLGGSAAGHTCFYLFQAATLAILVLAANTSFAGFPRLASFAAGAWMVLVTLPLLVLLLDRTNRAYAREWEELAVEASEVLGPPKPRHEVLVLVDGLDRAVPLEVVHCPNRDLVDCAVDAVAARVRPDTEVTVLLPRHGDQRRFRRLLHDHTGRELFAALSRLAGVNGAIVHPPAPGASAHHPAGT